MKRDGVCNCTEFEEEATFFFYSLGVFFLVCRSSQWEPRTDKSHSCEEELGVT